jgi:hypothetical protein
MVMGYSTAWSVMGSSKKRQLPQKKKPMQNTSNLASNLIYLKNLHWDVSR